MIKFDFINRIPPVFRNKYLLTVIIFILWLLFFDSNNLISKYKEIKNLNKLRAEREYYIRKIADDKKKLHELKTDDLNLEKFAREQYRMKKPDEDIYIILTPQEDRKIARKNN
jgi:cell division protein FtsB